MNILSLFYSCALALLIAGAPVRAQHEPRHRETVAESATASLVRPGHIGLLPFSHHLAGPPRPES